MSLKGMIIRCSSIIPEIKEAIFRCLICGYYSDPIVVDRGNVVTTCVFVVACMLILMFIIY